MYEPYPYQLSKVKVVSLILCSFALIGGLIYSSVTEVTIVFNEQNFSIFAYIDSLLQITLMLFCFKAFLLKYIRDYLYIGTAAFLVFMLQLFTLSGIAKLILKLNPTIINSFANIKIEIVVLSVLLLLTAFNGGKAVSARRRKLNLIFIFLIPTVIVIVISWILLYFIIPKYNITHLYLPIYIFSALILVWAEFKFIRLYDKKGYNIYFWLVTAIMFLLFSPVYCLFIKQPFDLFLFVSQACWVIGLFSLVWVTYEEHTRFMESEIDIRKALEKSLLQVENNLEIYRNLVNKVDVGIFVVDEEGLVTFSNERLGQMFGIPKEQLIGQMHSTLFDDANFDKFLIEREKWLAGLKSQFEIEILSRRGKNIPVLISSVPMKDRLGRFKGSRNVVIGITAWKEFERKIKQYSIDLEKKIRERTEDLNKKSEEWKHAKTYYETLISGMLDILLVVDKQGNCIFINEYGKKSLGFEVAELKRRRLPDFFADMENLQKNYGDYMKIELRDYEAELKTKSGQKILCSWNVRYLFDHKGKHIGAMCVGRDISEYKTLQRKLEDHSKNLEKVVAQRTEELNMKVNQLAKILKVGEDIIFNIKLPDILSNICGAIQSMGWGIVIIAIKQEDVPFSKIAAFRGIQKGKIQKFVSKREYLFKNTLKYLRNEYRIGHSYFLECSTITDENYITHGIENQYSSNQLWHEGDVLLCPVKIKNRILGFIMVFEPTDGLRPNKDKTQILEIFAQKAAVGIENKQLFREIESRAKELESVNKLKSEFFANMSHELRTPLNSVLTLTSILLQKMTGDLNSEQVRQLRIIKRNGERLLKLINDILDLSKIEAGRMEVVYSYFSITDTIEACIDTIRPLCDKKRLGLELKVDKKVPQYVFSDRDKIDHVLTNILSNSVKFTNKGKIVISVNINSKAKLLDISIKDTGLGIDKRELKKIFRPFHQSENQSTPQNIVGTGLGLSISKELWQMLGGIISVESKKGKGTLFTLQLPLKEVSEREQIGKHKPSAADKRDSQKDNKRENYSKPENQKKRILLVDDNLDNQYAVKFILEDKGYHVSFAKDGEEGVKKAFKERPVLILMDMMMPGVDGYQATEQIRAKKEFKKTPIIAMTAKTKQEDGGKAIKAGCSDYLSKPFSLEDVVKKVNKWIGH